MHTLSRGEYLEAACGTGGVEPAVLRAVGACAGHVSVAGLISETLTVLAVSQAGCCTLRGRGMGGMLEYNGSIPYGYSGELLLPMRMELLISVV